MSNTYLAHYGTKGMKWGTRKYQNKDGSLTPEGKARRAKQSANNSSKKERTKELAKKVGRAAVSSAAGGAAAGAVALAFAAAAPGSLPATALVAFGKTVATSVASNVGFTLANEAINSPEFKKGKKKVYSMLKGG